MAVEAIVAADVTDEQPTRGCVVVGAIGIAQPQRPDGVVVGAVAVVERVVGRHRAVGVESQDLTARAGQILRGRALEVVAGGEVDLPVVAESDCTAVVFGGGVLGILVDDEFAARYGAGQCGIGREAREAIAVGCVRGVGDVIEVVGGEVRIQGKVIDALLRDGPITRRADIGELQEGCRVGLGIGRRQYLDRAAKLSHQHAPVGKELDGGRQIEAGRQNLVLEGAGSGGVGDVDGHRRRRCGVAAGVAGQRGQRVGAVGDRRGVPRRRCRARWCPRRPRGLLSTRNCTPATPTLSVALAVRVTVPETVALGAGAVMAAVGGVVSPLAAAAALKVATCMTQAPLTGAVAL